MILKIELKDLEADLATLEEATLSRKEDGQISNYVYLENMAVLKEEIQGIEKIILCLNEADPEQFSSIDDFIEKFTGLCRENRRNADLPEGVYQLFRRKINKVKNFMFE